MPASDEPNEYQRVNEAYAKEVSSLRVAYMMIADASTKEKLQQDVLALPAKYADEMLEIASRSSAQPVVYDALMWVVIRVPGTGQSQAAIDRLMSMVDNGLDSESAYRFLSLVATRTTGSQAAQAMDRLLRDYVNDPLIESVCETLMTKEGTRNEAFLKAVYDRSTNLAVKGFAAFSLAVSLQRASDRSGDISQSAAAERLLLKVVNEYGDESVRSGRLYDLARKPLAEIQKVGIGKWAPEIEGEDLRGRKFKLSDHRGKVVLIDFWGTWCPACREMFPEARALVERMADRPFTLVGVNSDSDREAAVEWLKTEDVTWRSFWNGERGIHGKISRDWFVSSWPALFLIDANGIIRYKSTGPPPPGVMQGWIETLLRETKQVQNRVTSPGR